MTLLSSFVSSEFPTSIYQLHNSNQKLKCLDKLCLNMENDVSKKEIELKSFNPDFNLNINIEKKKGKFKLPKYDWQARSKISDSFQTIPISESFFNTSESSISSSSVRATQSSSF